MPTASPSASEPAWFKSSYSGGNATECLECAYVGDVALIRDSKHGHGSVLAVRQQTWTTFVGSVRVS
ncbi:DUF397 domain-containing protein [Streptomyces sp. NPDC015237]|uniref:DUF397 domain-containing protein n=1 Tax=Streptomyces sp. NPDC015237 TaxID=3364949 RepID=UPI0036F94D30